MSQTPNERLGRRATRGTVFGTLGQFGDQIFRLVGNVVLSRLLFPEAFGLMAIANLILTALQMMSNVGIRPALIRHPRGEEPVFLDTAWTLQILRGLLLFAIGLALAIPMAGFYDEPELRRIVPVVTFAAIFQGLFSTRLATQMRHIQLGRVVAIETGARAASVTVMIALAWVYGSVWALVAGGLTAAAVQLVLSHTALPGPRNRLRFEPEAAREIFSFGKWIFVSTLFTFLSLRIDVALLGKLLPVGVLGVYSIGVMLPAILGQLSGKLIQVVLMPALSESYRTGEAALRDNFASARSVILPVGVLASLGLALLAPSFFHYLYDARYHDAGWIAQLAVVPVWFTFLQESSGRVLLARGDSRSWALSNVWKTFVTGLGCLIGFQLAGLPGLIVGVGVAAALGHAYVVIQLAWLGFATAAADLLASAAGLALAALCIPGAAWLVAWFGWPDVPIVHTLVGLALLAPFGAGVARHTLRALRTPG
ncbi:MAG: oligosaccharide flippase family protein [Myxococcales bacterium]|nr:oligosaccharide flippase family protein [Myxococcales bacterium]